MKTKFWRLVMSGVVVASIGLSVAACGGDDDAGPSEAQAAGNNNQPQATPTPERVQVQVLDNLFEPRIRSSKVGLEVEWVWDSANEHSVVGTYNGETIDSGKLKGGGTFSHKFDTPGTFDYKCGVHGDSMKGQVIIQ